MFFYLNQENAAWGKVPYFGHRRQKRRGKRGKCNEILITCPLFTFIVFASIEKQKNTTWKFWAPVVLAVGSRRGHWWGPTDLGPVLWVQNPGLSSPTIGPKWADSVTYLALIVAAMMVFSSPEETELTVIISWLLLGLINTQTQRSAKLLTLIIRELISTVKAKIQSLSILIWSGKDEGSHKTQFVLSIQNVHWLNIISCCLISEN